MVDYLYDVMLVFLCDEDGVGPEDHEEKENASNNEENEGVITFVVFEVAAEVVFWIDQCQDRPSVDCKQNSEESHKHSRNLMPIDGFPIYKVVEHTHEDRSKSRYGMHDIQGQIDLRPAQHKRMYSKDEASDEEYSELKGGAELQLIAFDLADGVGDDGLHDVAGELGFDERHVVLVAVDEASYPEEIGDAYHNKGEVVIRNEAQGAALETDFAGHYQSCFKSYPTLSHQKTRFLSFCCLLPVRIEDFYSPSQFQPSLLIYFINFILPFLWAKNQKQSSK